MSILRMFHTLEVNSGADIAEILDTPESGEEDIVYVTDRWLSTLRELKSKSRTLQKLIHSA